MADLPEQLVVALSADISKLDKQLQKALGGVSDYAKKQEGMFKGSFDKVERMAAQVNLQNKLTVASAGGDTAAVRSLQEQLELSKQIQRFRSAGMDQGAAEAAARSHLGAVASAQATAAAAQRAAAMEQIALEEKLEVARARGERREVDALEEEMALSRAIAKYRSVGFSEAQSKEMAGNQLAALVGARHQGKQGNVGVAVEKALEHSRVGVLEEGATRIPIFGSALEALGPAGLVAAGGVLAAAEAMEHAKEAAEYAEELSNAAAKLGVTTKALQEYQYAALASGVGTDTMREALQKGNEVLGAFQSGVGAAKIKPVFQALGITQEEAQKANSISDLLPEIADKIKGLGSTAEQAKVAEKLGLGDILPVLQKGKEGVAELTDEAQRSGAVLDSNLIEKGKQAAEELKKASDVVDVQMKRAFIELAPAIEACLGLAIALARTFADTVENFGAISSFSRTHAKDTADNSQRTMDYWAEHSGGALTGKGKVVNGELVGGTAFARWKYDQAKGVNQQSSARVSDLDKEDAAEAAKLRGTGAKTLVADKPKREKKVPEDKTDSLDKAASDAREGAAKELASAQAALVKGFMEHAAFERAAVDADTDKKLKDLAAEEATIRKSKNDAHKAQQLAAVDAAKADTQSAANAKKELIDRQALEAQQAYQREVSSQIANAMADHLTNEASIASTSAERRKFELQALSLRQDEERKAFEAQALIDMRDHGKSQDRVDQQRDLLEQSQADTRSDVIRSTNSPGRAFDRDLNMQKDDLSDQLQGVEVAGVEQLGDALEAVITQTKSVKDAFRDMAMSIVGDLLKIEIRRNIETPLADMLFAPPKGEVTVGAIKSTPGMGAVSGADLGVASTGAAVEVTALGEAAAAAALRMGVGGLGNSSGVPGAMDIPSSAFAAIDAMGVPKFATGTDDAPGGEALVGEKGPELVKLPGGSQVMTNSALNGLPTSGPGGGGHIINMTHRVTIDLTGANGDDAIAQAAHSAALAAYTQAVATSRKDMQRGNRSRQQSLIGR